MKNTGKASEENFEEILAKVYGKKQFAYKVVDTYSAGKIVKSAPADWVVCIEGTTYWVEVKSSSHKTSFPFANFTKAQLSGMVRQNAAGGRYKIFIQQLPIKQWYEIDSHEVMKRLNDGIKSISWKELANFKFLGPQK